MSILGIGSAAAFGAGGKAGAITGTALGGAEGIVGAATGGKKSEGAKEKGGGGKAQMLEMMKQLLEGLMGAQGQAGAQGMLQELQKLGKQNPDLLGQALKSNPGAAQELSSAMS
jgi:hypothetical protein